MLFGKKKKFMQLQEKYEKLENDSLDIEITELYDNGNMSNRNLSAVFSKNEEYEKISFIIETQQFRILTEMFLLMPDNVDYEKLQIFTNMFYKSIQQFIGLESTYNADRILLCKIFLGKQYKYYKNNILELNDGMESGELGNIEGIMYWISNLAQIAGNYGYYQYGREILENTEIQLTKNGKKTEKMLEDIKLGKNFLSKLESEQHLRK